MKGIPTGKIGPRDVVPVRGGNTVNNTGGNAGKSMPQKPIPGPVTTGGPVSLKRALAKKSMPSKGL
jgi:hypothetical protein